MMMNNRYIKKPYLISHFLNSLPNTLQTEIISDGQFCIDNEITTDVKISFSGTAAFSRSKLFDAVREAYLDSEGKSEVLDDTDKTWVISTAQDDGTFVHITNSECEFKSNTLWPLKADISQRCSDFEYVSVQKNLAKSIIEHWKPILSQECLSDEEAAQLIAELDLSQISVAEQLSYELSDGHYKLSTLVQTDIRYYERIIGKLDSSTNVSEYCENELPAYFSERVVNSIHFTDLLLCSHQSIAKVLAGLIVSEEDYVSLAQTAIQLKNPLAIIGCIEIASNSSNSSFKQLLKLLYEALVSTEVMHSIKLLCGFFIMIDAELARLKVFDGKPPFYRRFAAFTQASLFVKAAVETKRSKFDGVEKWAMQERGALFYCQTFIDLRSEPRWLPYYLTSEQIFNEFLSRVQIAVHSDHSLSSRKILDSIANNELPFSAFYPGPLEGNIKPSGSPDLVQTTLEESLNREASLEAFIALINLSQVCSIEEKYLELTVSLLEKAQHQLNNTKDKNSIFQTLDGLAQVAGTFRSKKLATSVMILSRVYREYLDANSQPENILSIGLVAASAYKDKDEWAEFIGQWLQELVHLPLDSNAVLSLLKMIEQLALLEPYLYFTCSRSIEILKQIAPDNV